MWARLSRRASTLRLVVSDVAARQSTSGVTASAARRGVSNGGVAVAATCCCLAWGVLVVNSTNETMPKDAWFTAAGLQAPMSARAQQQEIPLALREWDGAGSLRRSVSEDERHRRDAAGWRALGIVRAR